MQAIAEGPSSAAAPSALPPSQPSLSSLPDPLIAHTLSLIGGHEGAAGVPLACKRLNSLLFSEPSIWRTFRLDTDTASQAAMDSWRTYGENARTSNQAAAAKRRWLAARLALLQRQAGMVERLEICDRYDFENELSGTAASPPLEGDGNQAAADVSLPVFLASLQPGQVQAVQLRVNELSDSAVQQLPRLAPQLTRLCIDTDVDREGGSYLPASTPTVLLRLPQLLSLEIATQADVPDGVIDAVGRLTRLTDLNLWCGVDAPVPALPRLTRLQRLNQLQLIINWHLCEAEEEPEVPQLPLLARFPALRTYRVNAASGPEMAGLRPWSLYYEDGRLSAQMSQGGLSPLPGLADVAVPPAVPLYSIAVDWGTQRAADLQQPSSRLAGLTRLSLVAIPYPNLAAVLHELLPGLPRLADLSISRVHEFSRAKVQPRAKVPAEVVAASYDALHVLASRRLPGLTRLVLHKWALSDLPTASAPCLQGLQELSLADNRLDCIPPALLAVTGLRKLELRFNPALRPTCADIVRLLRAMPGLTRLDLTGTYNGQPPPGPVLEFVRRVAPQLSIATRWP